MNQNIIYSHIYNKKKAEWTECQKVPHTNAPDVAIFRGSGNTTMRLSPQMMVAASLATNAGVCTTYAQMASEWGRQGPRCAHFVQISIRGQQHRPQKRKCAHPQRS